MKEYRKEKYKEDYENLQLYGIYVLREIARNYGINCPTKKRRETLEKEIILVYVFLVLIKNKEKLLVQVILIQVQIIIMGLLGRKLILQSPYQEQKEILILIVIMLV